MFSHHHIIKSIYNSPFKDSYSHPIHTWFVMIASNDTKEVNENELLKTITFLTVSSSPTKMVVDVVVATATKN